MNYLITVAEQASKMTILNYEKQYFSNRNVENKEQS